MMIHMIKSSTMLKGKKKQEVCWGFFACDHDHISVYRSGLKNKIYAINLKAT